MRASPTYALVCSAVRRLVVALAVGSFLSSGVVAAQDTPSDLGKNDSDLEHARELFAQGIRLASEERWAEAAENFRRSHELSSEPIALYNLALAYRSMGRFVEARDAFDTLLAAPGSLRADRLATAQELRAQTASQVGRVRILGLGSGLAEVALDGRAQSPSPERPLLIEAGAGRHAITVRQEGREVVRWSGNIEGGADVELEAKQPGVEAAVAAQLAVDDGGSNVGSVVLLASSAALVVGSVVFFALGASSTASVESAPEGTEWRTVASDNDNAPLFTGVGVALAVSAAASVVVGLLLLESDTSAAPERAQGERPRWF